MTQVAFNKFRKYGIEIEGYNLNRDDLRRELEGAGIPCEDLGGLWNYPRAHRNIPEWKIVHDGSIRDEDGNQIPTGFELVSPPLVGVAGFAQIRKACEVLNRLGAKVNKSCGFHVHHDATAWDAKEFKNVLLLYARMEETLDEVVPGSRRVSNNFYTKSVVDRVRWDVETLKRAKTISEVQAFMNNDRYYKVNVMAYNRHNTIEFRHHSATTDAEKIINWVILTQLICTHSEGKTPKVAFDREYRFKNLNAYYCLTGDLAAIRRSFSACAQEVQDCIHFYCKRINKFRKAEAKGQPIRRAA